MIKNYLKTAFRNLWRKRQTSLINFLGMSVALTVVVFIFLFIYDEQNFDRFHTKAKDIYRITTHSRNGWFGDFNAGMTGIPQGPAFAENIDEIEAFVRVKGYPELVRVGAETAYADMLYVDSNFFDVFTFPLLMGEAREALKRPDQIIISAEQAAKWFGEPSVLGQTIDIQVEDDRFASFTIAAIAQNPPGNSSIQFDFILPFLRYQQQESEQSQNDWISTRLNTFLQLRPGTDPSLVAQRFAPILAEKGGAQLSKMKATNPNAEQWYGLQPLKAIHLDEDLIVANGLGNGSNPVYSYILSLVAFLIVLIASINFINLSLAQSLDRSREVGVRKVIGGSRKQLVFQFLAESWLLVGIAILPALVLVQLLLPIFNRFTNKVIEMEVLQQWPLLLGMLGFQVVLGFLAGLYPALVLSGFRPIQALSSTTKLNGRHHWAKGLVVVQFSLAILFVLVASFLHYQFKYIQNKDLGYQPENLIGIDLPWEQSTTIATLFKEELATYPFIQQVTARSDISKYGLNSTKVQIDGDKTMMVGYGRIDTEFIPAFGIQLLAGENFSDAISSDTLNSAIVNEAFIRATDWANPIGQSIKLGDEQMFIKGVVKDFHTESLKEEIKPLVLYCRPNSRFQELWVKTSESHAAETVKLLENIHAKHLAYLPFEYSFLESDLSNYYKSEARWQKMVNLASALMLFIAGLGIMGLSALSVIQRTREIGIRKILGATVQELVTLLSVPLLRLVGLAFLIATPLAWYLGNQWLSTYAFHIEIQWWMFVWVGIGTFVMAFLTVGIEAFGRARANPVQSIRQE
ncbi:MAG: ABC transporter permease [Saprospiraceae bacterium]